ncbi:GumC family protein [Rhizobium rhizogenes]|uniref:GumC family protein n=1 Tax=Rhizobium rhizogenes TaxID=359 RepID=UPI0004D35AE2|nr:polysaccharide biosynthesis protein [Rhizobium rhizogenes]OCI93620.1 polysaccharide biosynthesis protein [Agrobacterium sp. 13-626]KEA03409.1 polysaccharide biosynthesis protein [Rhizobium rhizogenes]MQB32780.1 polysaccharide biosynthesis protein [Rhizobium rhizogenes]NTF63881.1 polysaccharide biosynthesis protein [Rhizobium rhizogenes]NTF70555.1 polysaccharide biosynthesis protein [Rhizobium rhizogenes]
MTKQNAADPVSPITLVAPATENHALSPDTTHDAPGNPAPRYSLRRFLLGGTAVIAIALFAWPMLPRVYESTATLVLRPTDNEGQTDYAQAMRQPLDENSIISALDAFNSVALAQNVIDANQLAMDDEFKVKQGLASKIHSTVISMLDSILPETLARNTPSPSAKDVMAGNVSSADTPEASKLRSNLWAKLVVNRNRLSYTVNVGFRSNDPLKAATLTKSLVSAYLDAQVKRKIENVDGMNKLLEDHVRQARDRANTSASEMEAFLEKSGLIDQGAEISLEAQLSALSTELATARARSIDSRTRADSLEVMKSKGTLDSAPEVLASPTIQHLNQSLTESMSRLAVMSTESRNILEQAQVERDRIVASVRVEADNWAEREQLLSAEIDKIRLNMVERRKAGLRLDQLRREADNDAQVLADAQTRLKTRAPTLEALKPDAEVLSPATVPVRPVFPILPLYAAGSLGMAFLAGAGMNASAIRRDAKRLLKI